MKPMEKIGVIAVIIFWVIVAIAFFIYSSNERRSKTNYDKAYAAVEKECENKRVSNQDYSPEAAYDLYHDNGPQNPPVCRQPVSQDEVNKVIEQRRYRQQLENGDIDPPTVDEHCYTASICQ